MKKMSAPFVGHSPGRTRAVRPRQNGSRAERRRRPLRPPCARANRTIDQFGAWDSAIRRTASIACCCAASSAPASGRKRAARPGGGGKGAVGEQGASRDCIHRAGAFRSSDGRDHSAVRLCVSDSRKVAPTTFRAANAVTSRRRRRAASSCRPARPQIRTARPAPAGIAPAARRRYPNTPDCRHSLRDGTGHHAQAEMAGEERGSSRPAERRRRSGYMEAGSARRAAAATARTRHRPGRATRPAGSAIGQSPDLPHHRPNTRAR